MSENGHGMLTASNWVQHDCQTFEIESLRELLETANSYGAGENAARLKAEAEVERLRAELAESERDAVEAAFLQGKAEAGRDALLGTLKWLERWLGHKSIPECAAKIRSAITVIDAARKGVK
jgi:hypothetical protein